MTDVPLPDAATVQVVFRVIHELCELGGDAYAWRAHLFSWLVPATDSQIGVAYVMRHPVDPADLTPRMPLIMNFSANESWERFMDKGDLSDNPLTPAIMARMGTDFTCARQELIDDQTWDASAFKRDVATPAHWDETLNSQVAISPLDYVDGLALCRAPGKPPFGPREVTLVRFLHGELGRLWRRPDPLGVHTLPDRHREVLDGIRRGESRKQIAERLFLSEHTVHSYEKALFAKAGVNSRGGLLARVAKVMRPNLLP